jgi:ABC-type polar amino acid transport system ATPase subunit
MGFAREVVDRVVMMDDSRILENTEPKVFSAPRAECNKAFFARILR